LFTLYVSNKISYILYIDSVGTSNKCKNIIILKLLLPISIKCYGTYIIIIILDVFILCSNIFLGFNDIFDCIVYNLCNILILLLIAIL